MMRSQLFLDLCAVQVEREVIRNLVGDSPAKSKIKLIIKLIIKSFNLKQYHFEHSIVNAAATFSVRSTDTETCAIEEQPVIIITTTS